MTKLLFIFSLIFAFSNIDIFACTCVKKNTIKKEYETSQEVLIGRVKKISQLVTYIHIDSSEFEYIEVQVEVVKNYKGNSQKIFSIFTPVQSEACGFTFTENENYLIYLSAEGDNLITTNCFRTENLKYANKDIKWLERNNKR